MKKVLFALFALALCSSMAAADVPDPALCSVLPADALNGVILNPQPVTASIYTATVKNNANNPIANASVVVELTPSNVTCGSTVLTGLTNASGVVTITLGGGGCLDNTPSACVWKANGVTIRSYGNTKSPDNDGGGNLAVNLGDFNRFAEQFNGIVQAICADYDNDNDCDGGDLTIFGPPFSLGHSCAP